MNYMKEISVSIVSHGHDFFVEGLLAQLAEYSDSIKEVIVTHNIRCSHELKCEGYSFEILTINNIVPLGFAKNHNQAFSIATGEYFCVLNPDIILKNNPFNELLDCFNIQKMGLVAPLVVNLRNEIEDSARYFPTPLSLFKKIFGLGGGVIDAGRSNGVIYSEWLAGMFMLLPSKIFHEVGRFDEKFWLYYEDVDLCLRVWAQGYGVALCNRVEVIHEAQRESHRNYRFFLWHVSSAIRFFRKHLCRFPQTAVNSNHQA